MIMETIKEAKDHLYENALKGTTCPCCNQFVKFYKRSINSSMAYVLILMRDVDEFTHIEKMIPKEHRGDFHKLRFWGLIEAAPIIREDGSNRNGLYKITEKGRKFIRRQIKVPKYLYMYNGRPVKVEFENKTVDIKDCLKSKFNYNELMNGYTEKERILYKKAQRREVQ